MKPKPLLTIIMTIGFSSSILASELIISSTATVKSLSSASGIVNLDGKIFAIGDDSSQLFTLNSHFQIIDEYLITPYMTGKNGRIPKKLKPDFESIDVQVIHGKLSYVVLGSGSKKHTREKGFVIAQDGGFKIERNLTALYDRLHQVGQFNTQQTINIEGLASNNENVFILNRGNSGPNMLFEVNKQDFESFITGRTESIDSIIPYSIKLPEIGGIESGISGATYDLISQSLFLTASVEATGGSAYDDGEILGSFVVELPVKNLIKGKKIDLSRSAMLLNRGGKKMITKVESITIFSHEMNVIKGVLASDNDDGTSEFFDFVISESK